MERSDKNKTFWNVCLIPMSMVSNEEKDKLISSKLVISKRKSNGNLRELRSEQIDWLQAVHNYFTAYYGETFSHERIVNQNLYWNTYFSSLDVESPINIYRYTWNLWNSRNRVIDFDNGAFNRNDHNDNNNIDGDDLNHNMNNVDMGIENDRDWLDNFYILSRVFILFSIVYFYSSPLRFLVVTFLGFSIYLYHNGLFRIIPAAHNLNNNVNNDEERLENRNDINIVPRPAGNQVNMHMQQTDFHSIYENQQRWHRILRCIWTFFTTFFTSLIPDQPNVI